MSRRWYRYAEWVVFFGWDPAEHGFYMNVVDLCASCGGTGEVLDTEEVCPTCGGEGIQLDRVNPSARRGGMTLEQLAAEFGERGLPLPDAIRADLVEDQRTNAGTLLREYEL
jgi:hypothetical protein